MNNLIIYTLGLLGVFLSPSLQALDVQLTNTTPDPVVLTIKTEATKAENLLTLVKKSIEGVPDSPFIDDLPIWRGTTKKVIRPGATVRIQQVHPIAESVTVNKQHLALTNLSDAQERSPKTLSFSIVPGKLWGITFERLGADYKPINQPGLYKEIKPRTTEYLTAESKPIAR